MGSYVGAAKEQEGYGRGRRVPPPAASPASLAECALRRQTPEVGAECPNWARSDLCGGRSAMGVPTAHSGECWMERPRTMMESQICKRVWFFQWLAPAT